MVGLIEKDNLTSSNKTITKKMCDSAGLEEENSSKVSNGDGAADKTEEPADNGSKVAQPEEKMDVDEEKPPAPASEEAANRATNEDNQVQTSTSRAERRSSRSSRSVSSNSSSSTSQNAVPDTKLEKKDVNSEDEDFLGFDLDPETRDKVESSIDQYKKAHSNFDITLDPVDVKEKAGSSDESSEKLATNSVEDESHVDSETPSSSRKSLSRSSTKKSVNIDITNPEFRKPFEYGWVRELVYRSTSDNSLKRNADVYYYTPSGKKVRSSREISEHLSGDLTVDNFTFFKEPTGINDPSKEKIREAKTKPGQKGFEDVAPPPVKRATPKPIKTATPPKVTKELRIVTPKIVIRGSGAPKAKTKSDKRNRKSAGPDDVVDVMVERENWSPEITKVNTQSPDSQCSIKCRLALGLIPSLQCASCVCLYHPACMGVSEEKLNRPSFVFKCKNCKVKQPKVEVPAKELPAPLSSKTESLTVSTGTIKVSSAPSAPLSSQTRPGIVGAITTWLPPTSSIKQGSEVPDGSESNQVIVYNPHGVPLVGHSKDSVMNIDTKEANAVDSNEGLYLIPCDPQHNGPQSVFLANGLKRSIDSPSDKDSPPEKKSKLDSKVREASKEDDHSSEKEDDTEISKPLSSSGSKNIATAQNFMMNLNAGFIALLHAFQYLRVYELLRAGHVSKMWQFVASHHSLWETVRMKNSRVSDWNGFGRTLSSRGTKYLDLRKMLVPESPEEQVKMWDELCKAVEGIKTLKKVDMGRCSPQAFIAMAEAAPQLESLVSMAINSKEKQSGQADGSRKRGNDIDLFPLSKCKKLKELKLKTVTGTLDIKDVSCLSKLTNLTSLALTTVKNLKGIEHYLPENLTSLELGECNSLSKDLATVALPKLVKLKRLRLEKGQGDCPTLQLLDAVSSLPELRQLELINFDIKPGFDKALAKCTNIRTLLIIPTYVTQSATTNHVVMGGVAKLSQTLTYFIWGLTLELLKVTDLFIGQVENQKTGKTGQPTPKKGSGDSIPILKPTSEGEVKDGVQAPSQVDILALPNLQRVLSTLLPTTKIKILKVPFSATWRQTVTDG